MIKQGFCILFISLHGPQASLPAATQDLRRRRIWVGGRKDLRRILLYEPFISDLYRVFYAHKKKFTRDFL